MSNFNVQHQYTPILIGCTFHQQNIVCARPLIDIQPVSENNVLIYGLQVNGRLACTMRQADEIYHTEMNQQNYSHRGTGRYMSIGMESKGT